MEDTRRHETMDEIAPLSPGTPATQEASAVRILIAYLNRLLSLPMPKSNEDLPEFYQFASGLCLVRDGKERDVYYVTTPINCSCPAKRLKPGEPCEHSRRFFPKEVVKAAEMMEELERIEAEEDDHR